MNKSDRLRYMTLSGALVGGRTDMGLLRMPFADLITEWRERRVRRRIQEDLEVTSLESDDVPSIEAWRNMISQDRENASIRSTR